MRQAITTMGHPQRRSFRVCNRAPRRRDICQTKTALPACSRQRADMPRGSPPAPAALCPKPRAAPQSIPYRRHTPEPRESAYSPHRARSRAASKWRGGCKSPRRERRAKAPPDCAPAAAISTGCGASHRPNIFAVPGWDSDPADILSHGGAPPSNSPYHSG